MIRRILVIGLTIFASTASSARAQAPAPDAALAAEADGRWDDAIRMHQAVLDANPGRADLWIRIADIEARRGNLPQSLAALERAAMVAPQDAAVHFRLSQAYSTAGRPAAALKEVERALLIKPGTVEYLSARATLATWVGDYSRARDTYRWLAALQPANIDVALAFGRVSAWAGDTDEAVTQFERYLKARPDAADAWIELARAASWRGNYGGAMRALKNYRIRFGETAVYSETLGAVMAGSGRPGRAEDVISPLLAKTPKSFELNLTHTIALAMQHRTREAYSSLETVREIAPERRETRDAERLVRTILGSTVEPQFNVYSDSDRLQIQRFTPKAAFALRSGTQLSIGYDRTILDARSGSGLEQMNGAASAMFEQAWTGLAQKLGALTFDMQGGHANLAGREIVTYSAGVAARAGDSVRLALHRTFGAVVISPRTVGLGLTQTGDRLQVEWTPTLQSTVVFDGSVQELSDGNRRVELSVSPRRSFARTSGFNLDLGMSAYRLETERDLANGYYDPRRYEHYAVTAYPYFKVTENVGLSLSTSVGAQRDAQSPAFRFGGTVGAEATFGIYQPWVLKINTSASMNQRLESGAFRGLSGGLVLVRRF